MKGLSPCPFCDGQGLVTFERGPAVEPCRECLGAGRIYADPSFKGVFAALLSEKGVFLDRDMRLLLTALDALDRRVGELEQTERSR